MRTTRAALAVIALLVSACAPAQPAETTAEPAPTPTATAIGSSVPTLTTTPAPSTASSATPQPNPSPFGAAVFTDPDDCVNPVDGYRVAYPDAWYSNAELANPLNPAGEGIAPCQFFASTDFEVTYGTEIPADVAVVIRRYDEWHSGAFSGRRVLSDQQTMIDGLAARVQEIEITERTLAFAPGDRFTEYVVELEDGSFLVAATYVGSDYESARTVLDDMMQTLELQSP